MHTSETSAWAPVSSILYTENIPNLLSCIASVLTGKRNEQATANAIHAKAIYDN